MAKRPVYDKTLITWVFETKLQQIIKKKKILPLLYVALVTTLAYTPWLVRLLGAMNRVKESYWIPAVTGEVIQRVFTYPFSNKFTVPFNPNLPVFGYMIAIIMICRGIISQSTGKSKNVFLPVMAMATYLFTIIAGIAASWIIRPVLVERYMVPVLGLFILALSYGLAHPGKNAAPRLWQVY